jgi:hypothetical protein
VLFGGSDGLLSEREFAGDDRDKLLEYLEICRRIFITQCISLKQNID